MTTDDFDQATEAAKTLAKTNFAEAEAALSKLMPEAKAADRDDPDNYCSATVLDALAEIHVRKAFEYWQSLVEVRGGRLGECWTGDSFPHYCGDRSGAEPWE